MVRKRRRHTAAYKLRVALEALEGSKTISQLSSEHEVHPNLIRTWKRQLLEDGPRLFATNGERRQREQEAQEAELYEQMAAETLLLRRRPAAAPRRPALDEVWPVHSAGAWPEGVSLRREEASAPSAAPAGTRAFSRNVLSARLRSEKGPLLDRGVVGGKGAIEGGDTGLFGVAAVGDAADGEVELVALLQFVRLAGEGVDGEGAPVGDKPGEAVRGRRPGRPQGRGVMGGPSALAVKGGRNVGMRSVVGCVKWNRTL